MELILIFVGIVTFFTSLPIIVFKILVELFHAKPVKVKVPRAQKNTRNKKTKRN